MRRFLAFAINAFATCAIPLVLAQVPAPPSLNTPPAPGAPATPAPAKPESAISAPTVKDGPKVTEIGSQLREELAKQAIPEEGNRKEIFFGKEIQIETVYVNLSMGERRIYKLRHKAGDDFADLRGVSAAPEQKMLDDGVVVFTGAKEGTGQFVVFDGDPIQGTPKQATRYVVFVSKSQFSETLAALRELVGDVEGLEIKVVGNRIVLDGEILIPSEYRRVLKVVESGPYSELVDFYASPSPLALQMIARRIEEEIRDVNVNVRVLNNRIILEGNVESPAVVERYLTIAKGFLPEEVEEPGAARGAQVKKISSRDLPKIESLLVVASENAPESKKVIQVTMHYVQLTGDYTSSFSFIWAPTLKPSPTNNISFNRNVAGQANGFSSTFTAIIDSLFPRLSSARSHGHANVLRTSTVLVQDQEQSTVQSEITVPFTVVEKTTTGEVLTQSVERVTNETTVAANILPGKDASQRQMLNLGIKVKFQDQISATGNGSGGSSRPSVSTNSVDTVVSVANGQSVALGGLISDAQRADYNKPPSGDVNALFKLQRAKNYSHDNSKFVVFITPKIVEDPEKDTEETKRRFRLRRGITGE